MTEPIIDAGEFFFGAGNVRKTKTRIEWDYLDASLNKKTQTIRLEVLKEDGTPTGEMVPDQEAIQVMKDWHAGRAGHWLKLERK